MDRASKRMPSGVFLGAVVLAAGTIVPDAASSAATLAHGLSMVTPGLGCGSAETQVGTAKLLARVRAEGAATVRRRGPGKSWALERRVPQHAARPSAPLPRQARRAPQAEQQEPRAGVLRSFYTCSTTPVPNFAEGTGWRLVGPLRRS